MQIKTIVLNLVGILLVLPCLFFIYYTVRLIYINLAVADIAEHRSGGMLIGAIVFPVAAIVFGILSWLCFKLARGSKQNQPDP